MTAQTPVSLLCGATLFFFASCHCAVPPFNLPPWPATYDMRASTLTMACNYTGTLNASHYARFGLVDVDWSNHKEGSVSSWANQHPMNTEVSLERQAAALKSVACPRKCPLPRGCASRSDCPSLRVFVYRNLVKVRGPTMNTRGFECVVVRFYRMRRERAVIVINPLPITNNPIVAWQALPWFGPVREKLEDPAYHAFFVPFGGRVDANGSVPSAHVPACDRNFPTPKCSALYHDQSQTPQYPRGSLLDGSCLAPCDCGGVPCGE